MSQIKHTDVCKMPEKQRELAGKELGCFRLIQFENATVIDGKMDASALVSILVIGMLERSDIRRLIKSASKLHKKLKKEPLALLALKALLSGRSVDAADCDCLMCQLRRDIERIEKDN